MADDESGEEWRFSVDEFDDRERAHSDSSNVAEQPVESDPAERGENDDANVAGEFSPDIPVVPEMPTLENAAFVTLGAILTVLAFAAVGIGSFGLVHALTVVVIVGGIGALLYGAFVRLTPDT